MGLPISLLSALCISPNSLWGETTYSSNSGSSSESSQYISFVHFLLGYLLSSYGRMGTRYILKITALLGSDAQSRNIPPPSECTIQWFSVYAQSWATIATVWFQNIFIISKRSLAPQAASPHFSPSPPSRPRQLPVSFLTLQICLAWIFPINAII